VRSNYLASRGWLDFTRKDNGLNQYSGWWNYSVTNYDADLGGVWGSPGHANGVLMQDGWITGSYNALNQPVSMWSPAFAGTANWMWFAHDPLGRCVKRWIGPSGTLANTPTYYYYDGWSLIQEGGSATNATRVYVHGARVDEIVAQITPGNNWQRYFQYDARGHCTLQTDASGDIVEQYDYDAFGFPYFYDRSGNTISSSPWGNRFLFTGREWVSELRTYDFRNRMYQPELGRFLQPDPIQFAAGDYNLYRYCHNDPINKSDPMGLVPPGEGLVDITKDMLKEKMNSRRTKHEFRRTKFRDSKSGKEQTVALKGGGKIPGVVPRTDLPKNPFGEDRGEVWDTHSHVDATGRPIGSDPSTARFLNVPSASQSATGGPMFLWVPSATRGGEGGLFYSNNGMDLYNADTNLPAPH